VPTSPRLPTSMPPRKVARPSWSGAALGAVVVLVLSTQVFPFFWLFLTSLKSQSDASAWPPLWIFRPTLANYREVFFDPSIAFSHAFLNSVFVTLMSTAVSIVFGLSAAYALTRFRFKGRGAIQAGVVGIQMLPAIVMVIPLFLMLSRMQLLDTRLGLVLVYSAFSIPIVTWMLQGFLVDIPVDIEEAALVDGCSKLQALRRVLLPVMSPGLAATAIFAFIWTWNDFIFALIFTRTNATTFMVAAAQFRTEQGILWGPVGASTVIAVLPVLVFTLLAQRQIVRGLTFGAVKG
jgi:multiple sugar transport system permease protein